VKILTPQHHDASVIAAAQRHSAARAAPHSTHTRTVHDDSFWIHI
jgi:hypothetical protein